MAEATATVVNEAALAMPLEQAAGSAASATSVTTPPAPAAPADDGVFSSIKRAFTGDPNKPPPRAVDVEAELKAKLDALPKTHISIKASARNLDKMDKFKGSSDPFLRISKFDPETKLPTLITETTRGIIQTELNPDFEELMFPKDELILDAKGDAGIIFEVFDFNISGNYPRIGGCGGSLSSVLSGAAKEFNLVDPEKKKKDSSYVSSGKLIINEAKMVPSPQKIHDLKEELEELKEEYDDWVKDQAEKAAKAAKEA